MYQAIVTEAFAELLQRHDGDLTAIPEQASSDLQPLVKLLKNEMVNFQPVFPGSSDPEMKRHYKVSLSSALSPADIQQLQANPAFESFYEKPADELPM
jgi:hypothetical protein